MTPSRISRKISAPFRPISLNGVISAVIAPPVFSASSLVQKGCSKFLYWVRLPQAPTTFSEVLGMSWATAVPARPAATAPASAHRRARFAMLFMSRLLGVLLWQWKTRASEHRQAAVLQVGDQHVAGRVGDAELGPDRGSHRLR